MFDIDITDFLAQSCMRDYSASIAEIGNDAGPATWRASCDDASDWQFLKDDAMREEFRAFVRSSGGWDDAEIAAWSDNELQALCLQWIAGDVRKGPLDDGNGPEQWAQYREWQERGQCSGILWRDDETGRCYWTLSAS